MIWKHQTTFCILLEDKAKTCFQHLDQRFNPKIFLFGILENGFDKDPLSFEFDCSQNGEDLIKNFRYTIAQKITSDTLPTILECFNGNGPAKKIIDSNRLKKTLENLFNLDNDFLNYVYCSQPERINEYSVFLVIALEKKIVDEYYHLNNQPDEYFVINTSLIDAVVEQFLHDSSFFISTKTHPAKLFLNFTNTSEILRSAAFRLIASVEFICNSEHPTFTLYNSLNEIASLNYEGNICKNELLIVKECPNNVNFQVRLKHPISINNHKSIRKLLEIAPNTCVMMCDSQKVYGWGKLDDSYDMQNENHFTVRFLKKDVWELLHNEHSLMKINRDIPSLPHTQYHKQQFFERINAIIPLENGQIDKLWQIYQTISSQKHGTTLVISQSAALEVMRLETQSFPIEPFDITPELMESITSIDGAVLLDTELKCHGIGVILDGVASSKCDAARGSRYNSAIKYTEYKNDCIVIVVSEDGPVDIFPKK